MTRIDIDEIRLRYRAACTAYHFRAMKVTRLSKGGASPPASELEAEEHALRDLEAVRGELLSALEEFSRAPAA